MKNATSIVNLAQQTGITAGKIEQLVIGVQTFEDLGDAENGDAFMGFVLDEVEHLQRIVLEITKLISAELPEVKNAVKEDESGGSVFAEGDLTSVKNGKAKPKANSKEA